MTPLATRLAERIAATGPMTLADYMTECLLDPIHGYYTTRDPLGAAGDFTTAPEISQMFGELLGLCLAQAWLDRGSPAPFRLAELGPGRGTLMADMLRATMRVPGFHDALDLHLVEASPALRVAQSETIDFRIQHHDRFDDVPDGPLFLVANEFFDALPIRQFQRDGEGWRERVVGLEHDRLKLGLADPNRPSFLEHRLRDTAEGEIVEVSPAAQTVAAALGQRIARYGGVALVFDYGDWRSKSDTFQALRRHEYVDPFDAPGNADLTAHVDFEALAMAADPAQVTEVIPQGVLLERLGITARAQTLAQSMSDDALQSHIAAHRRLTHGDEMGTLFKTIAFYQPGTPPPPGYDQP
ncbi:MAG: SAM-dependent methyltransferase [Silicimonas sp.]|jgi:SAM-dependent MidA family methyltransferase|nr:SAM-dependent methyltransferase [Silicimonas sp.]